LDHPDEAADLEAAGSGDSAAEILAEAVHPDHFKLIADRELHWLLFF